MCNISKLEILQSIVKTLYDNSIEHGLPHVNRVYKWIIKIVKEEGIDLDPVLLKLTALLHDIGRYIGEPHAYYSAALAEELLKESQCGVDFINQVITAVKQHSYSYSPGLQEPSKLGRILSDADKLDALGLIGFLRVFIYGERRNRSLDYTMQHFDEKILKLPSFLNYNYSRRVARKYVERVRLLLDMLREELAELNS
ncbi:MAG: HD domain-containing protein [Desulfurococcaceae archaeon]